MAIVKISDLPLVDSPVEGTDLFVVVQDNVTKKAYASDIQTYVGFEEVQTATAGQTVFNLTTMTYAAGANNLQVFVDGVNQYEGSSYIETDNNTVTFTQGLHEGALVKFSTVQTQTSSVANAAAVVYNPAGTGAVPSNVQDKLRRYIVTPEDFGAIGDGVTNDWEACQKACDYVQSLGGGTVIFTPGKTYRIAGNTVVIWGNNVKLIGYGATLYKDNAGGSAGTFGDALTIFGKLNNNLYYSPQVAGGTYTSPNQYVGATIPSVNISVEGFTITFGTHATDSINGISGVNFEHLTVKNVVVKNSPQTSFAWIATYGSNIGHLTMENCLSDGAGMQAFRLNSYATAPVGSLPSGAAGEVFAKLINCRSENTQLTVASPWPEQYGLPSSAFCRTGGTDIQFQVSFDNCQFDATTHLLDGYRTTSFRNCRLGFVFAFNASPQCELMFDNCQFRDFKVPSGISVPDSQIFARNYSGAKAGITIKGCTFETPVAGDYSIYNRGFDLNVSDCTGDMAVYAIDWSTDTPSMAIKNCTLKDPGSATLNFAGHSISIDDCVIKSPVNIIQPGAKSVTLKNNRIIVDSTFSGSCVVVTNGNVATINNVINYTNNAYATVLVAPIANTVLKTNQYLYAAGTELSYDETYGTTTPSTGYWQRSSRIINSQPNSGQPKAWTCTVAGAPGTWVSEGNL